MEYYDTLKTMSETGGAFVRIYLTATSRIQVDCIRRLLDRYPFHENLGIQFYLFAGCSNHHEVMDFSMKTLKKGRVDFVIPGAMNMLTPDGTVQVQSPPTDHDLEKMSKLLTRNLYGRGLCVTFSMDLLLPVWPTPAQQKRAMETLEMLTKYNSGSIHAFELSMTTGDVEILMRHTPDEFVWRHDPYRFASSTVDAWKIGSARSKESRLQICGQGDAMSMVLPQIVDEMKRVKASAATSGPILELVTQEASHEEIFRDRLMPTLDDQMRDIFHSKFRLHAAMKKQRELQRLAVSRGRAYTIAEMTRFLLSESIAGVPKSKVIQCALLTSPYVLLHSRIFVDADTFTDLPSVKSFADIKDMAESVYDVDIGDCTEVQSLDRDDYEEYAMGLVEGLFVVHVDNFKVNAALMEPIEGDALSSGSDEEYDEDDEDDSEEEYEEVD
jgi:hypothetical protein